MMFININLFNLQILVDFQNVHQRTTHDYKDDLPMAILHVKNLHLKALEQCRYFKLNSFEIAVVFIFPINN